MDNFETNPVTPDPESAPVTAGQLQSLRHLIVSVLMLVLVISGTFNIYLWRQVPFDSVRARAHQAPGGPNHGRSQPD